MSHQRAKALRMQQTEAEKMLWRHLRNRQLESCKVRRQHPIGKYIVDLVCIEKRLIIEIDGGQHMEQTEYDAVRSAFLEAQGYSVLRFWNNDVLNRMNEVLGVICAALGAAPLPPPLPPRGGEGDVVPTPGSSP